MKRAGFDVANEQAVLVAALRDPINRRKVTGIVTPIDFVGSVHREIFRSLLLCGDSKVDASILMLKAGSSDVGGRDYLDQLLHLDPPVDLDEHLLSLREASARAHAIKPARNLLASLEDRTIPHGECEGAAVNVLSALKSVRVERVTGKALMSDYMDDLKKRWSGDVRFVSTGYEVLDNELREGLAPGVFAVVCGRTRNGKTMFVVDMISRMLRGDPKPRILVLPLEIGKIRFLDMLVSNAAVINSDQLIKKPDEMSLDERERVRKKVERLVGSDDRLVVMDNPFYGMGSEWTNNGAMDMTERLVADGGYDVVFTDLWPMKLVDHRQHSMSVALLREEAMCLKYGYCSVAVSHVLREAEKEKDKRPKLAQLKGSGAWEESVGLALGVHREKAYKPLMRRDVIEVEILKQKMGSLGAVMEAEFEPEYCRLTDVRLGAKGDRKATFPADDDGGSGDVF